MPWRHMRAGIAYLLANRRRAGEADGCWLALFLISRLILFNKYAGGQILQEEIVVLV